VSEPPFSCPAVYRSSAQLLFEQKNPLSSDRTLDPGSRHHGTAVGPVPRGGLIQLPPGGGHSHQYSVRGAVIAISFIADSPKPQNEPKLGRIDWLGCLARTGGLGRLVLWSSSSLNFLEAIRLFSEAWSPLRRPDSFHVREGVRGRFTPMFRGHSLSRAFQQRR